MRNILNLCILEICSINYKPFNVFLINVLCLFQLDMLTLIYALFVVNHKKKMFSVF